jgi:hypothetical protein
VSTKEKCYFGRHAWYWAEHAHSVSDELPPFKTPRQWHVLGLFTILCFEVGVSAPFIFNLLIKVVFYWNASLFPDLIPSSPA